MRQRRRKEGRGCAPGRRRAVVVVLVLRDGLQAYVYFSHDVARTYLGSFKLIFFCQNFPSSPQEFLPASTSNVSQRSASLYVYHVFNSPIVCVFSSLHAFYATVLLLLEFVAFSLRVYYNCIQYTPISTCSYTPTRKQALESSVHHTFHTFQMSCYMTFPDLPKKSFLPLQKCLWRLRLLDARERPSL